jgi:hypothetical protein
MREKISARALVRATAALVCAAAWAAPGTARAQNEVHVYGIANFGGNNQCGDSDMTHSVHTSTASAFRTSFDLLQMAGLWDEVTTRNNSLARGDLFQDKSKKSTGNDSSSNAGADEPDVFYVHTHGSHNENGSSLSMGNASFACSVSTNGDMLWGNAAGGGDLEIAVVKACQSGDYNTWKNGGYGAAFSTSSSSFTMWNAFHGDSSCGGHVTDYVGDYSATSFNNGVGENWLDEAYDGAFWPWEDDDCPVSIVMGSSRANRDLMYEWGGFRDRKNTGSKTGSTYYYIAGCDPDNGVQLPD